MEFRRFLRGTVEWSRLETVARTIIDRYGADPGRIEFLEADNWLSTPFVVDDTWFVKVISPQNAIVHAIFTTGRNLGAFSSGTEGFFERFDGPVEMAQHELEATEKMRDIGVHAPEPIEALEVDGLGVLVLEYLPDFESLSDLDDAAVIDIAPQVFGALWTMHEHRLAHGDLRAENVLRYGGDLYFIDATNVREDGLAGARAYDLASALATLTPRISAKTAVAMAAAYYDREQLLAAREFLDFVSLRPDHDFETTAVKGEIETWATRND